MRVSLPWLSGNRAEKKESVFHSLNRKWAREITRKSGVSHRLLYFDVKWFQIGVLSNKKWATFVVGPMSLPFKYYTKVEVFKSLLVQALTSCRRFQKRPTWLFILVEISTQFGPSK